MDQFTSFYTARHRASSRDAFYFIEEAQVSTRFGVQRHVIRRQALGMRHRKISLSQYDLPNYDVDVSAPNSLQATNSVKTDTLGDAREEKSNIEDVVWMERKLKNSESLSINVHCDDTGIKRTKVSHEREISQHLQNFSRIPNFSHAMSSQCSLATTKSGSYTPHILSNVSPAHLDNVNSKNDKNEFFKEPVCISDDWACGINKPPLHNSSFAPKALSNQHRLSVLKNLKLRTPAHKPILPHLHQTDSSTASSNSLAERHKYKIVTPILDLQRQTRVLIPNHTRLKTPVSQVTHSLSSTPTLRPIPNAFQFSSKTILQTALINDQNINAAGQICGSKSEAVPIFCKNHHRTDLFNRERERLASFHFHVAPSQNLRSKSQRDLNPPDKLTDWSTKMSANKWIKPKKTEDSPKFESPADVIVQKILNQTWAKEQNGQAEKPSGHGEVAQDSLVGNSLENNANIKQNCVTKTVESHPTNDAKVYNHSNTESKQNLNDHQTDNLRLFESRQNDTKSGIKTYGSINYLDTDGTSDDLDFKIAVPVDKNDRLTELHKSTLKTTTAPSIKDKGRSTDLHVKHESSDMSDGKVADEVRTTLEKSSELLKPYDQSWEPVMCKRNALQETLHVETEEPLPTNLNYESLERKSPMIIGDNTKVFSKHIYKSDQGDSFDVITRGKIIVENNSQQTKNDDLAHHVHKTDIKQLTRSDGTPTSITNTDSISSTRGATGSSKHSIASSRSSVTERNISPHSQSLCTNDNDLPPLATPCTGSYGSLKNKEETSVIFKADNYVTSNEDNSNNGTADPVCGRRIRGEWIVCRDYSKASKYSTEYGGKHNVWTTKENNHGDLERADDNGQLCYGPAMLCNYQSRNEQGNTENVHNLKYHPTCPRPSDKKQIFSDESKHRSNVKPLINSSDSQGNADEPTSLMCRIGHSESNLSKGMSKSTGSLLASKLSFKFSEMAKNRNKE